MEASQVTRLQYPESRTVDAVEDVAGVGVADPYRVREASHG